MASAAATPLPVGFRFECQLIPAEVEGVCPRCSGGTEPVQPNVEDPERLIEVCVCCGEWIYRANTTDGRVQRVAILAGLDSAGACCPPRVRIQLHRPIRKIAIKKSSPN